MIPTELMLTCTRWHVPMMTRCQ